ncbi:hypothetical protein IEQ34_003691 [Dendrobium chrysotoxum]|uniref:Uncharacterized protein n=1 Tax=Dendrobium chrysotoxum TaxID=161865 RepID=A0AAV7HEF2_DENCH|nr:hypothetical protein IEQ34_003691 [Dendrobium chrysotoxum]
MSPLSRPLVAIDHHSVAGHRCPPPIVIGHHRHVIGHPQLTPTTGPCCPSSTLQTFARGCNLPWFFFLLLIFLLLIRLERELKVNLNYEDQPLNLKVLHVDSLKALEDWFEVGLVAKDGCLFPCLIELVL